MLKSILNATSKKNATSAKRVLNIESMEERKLMTTNVFLDFDGATQGQLNHACSEFNCWNYPRSGGLVGYEQGFNLLRVRVPVSPFHPPDGYSHWHYLATVARWCRPFVVSNYSWEALTEAARAEAPEGVAASRRVVMA